MAKKQMKIKRYSTNMGSGYQRKKMIKGIIGLSLALAVLLGAGYLAAPFIIDGIASFKLSGAQSDEGNPRPTPTAPAVDPSGEATPPTQEETPPQPVVPTVQTSIYCEVLPKELITKASIEKTAEQLKAKGANTAVITLKNAEGKLFFPSATDLGKQAAGDISLDLKLVADTFKASGITCCANVYTFMDKLAPTLDRTMAVKYVGTDYTWLDNAKELGGKPWANPANVKMQEYIYAITDEILSAGFKEIIYSAVQLPTGYSLDKRDFGATNDQLLAQIKGFITTVQTRVSSFGAQADFAFDFASANGGDSAKYLVSPTRLGAANIILCGKSADIDETSSALLVKKLLDNSDAETVSVWITDGGFSSPPSELSGYFIK